jgi:2,4-diketo-3-deoxy-L-fuconate hydrolase
MKMQKMPPGIGMRQTPPTYLHPGHRIRLGVDGLGQQSQLVT